RLQAADVVAVEEDAAGGGDRPVRGEQEAALAGAVGADERGDRAAGCGQADVGDRAGVTVPDGQPLDAQFMRHGTPRSTPAASAGWPGTRAGCRRTPRGPGRAA